MVAHPEVLGSFEVMSWRPFRSGVSLGEGRDTALNRPVTLVRLDSGASDSARDEFLTVARRLAGGRHRSLTTVLDVVEVGNGPYMVLESANGGTLRQWLAFFPPSQVEALRLADEVVEGLLAARSLQITAVDLNLDSVWIDRVKSAGATTRPEARLIQFRPLESVDPAGNEAELLKSLGRMLFAMFAGGREPDSEKSPRLLPIAPPVSNGVARLIEQLLGQARGWTLRTVARRISQLKREGQSRPLSWLAAGVLLGLVMAAPLFHKFENSENSLRPRDQSDIAPANSKVTTPEPAEVTTPGPAQAPVAESAEVQPVSLPPLNVVADFEPPAPGWKEFISSLPPESQVQAITVDLRRRNPGYDGQALQVDIEGGHVRGLVIHTDLVRDITPVAALTQLDWIGLAGRSHRSGQLESLRPLRGLQLREIRAGWTRVRDLAPLAGMPLKVLRIGGTRVEDLAPLKGLPLEELEIWSTFVRDLGPLRELPQLRVLKMSGILATDLTPLADLPLTRLQCNNVHVKDWSPLGKLPLQSLEIDLVATDSDPRSVLLEIKSLETINGKAAGEVLGPGGK